MQRILITGTNRGVGLEMVRQYLARPNTQLIATCRQPENAVELKNLADAHPGRVHIVALEVVDSASINAAAKTISGLVDGIDILINNAGANSDVDRERVPGQIEAALLVDLFQTNAVGALMLTQALLPLLQKGHQQRIVMVSSQMGSLGRANSGSSYGYRMSKAAMNMAARTLAADLKSQGITVITLHPGWVQTDMGGPKADITTPESASSILRLIDTLTLADTGKFLKWNGDEHVW